MNPKRLEPGQSFAGYEIEACLGSGGMGAVYLARRGPQRVALKLCHLSDAAARARFEREAMTLAQLGSLANIVPIHHYEAESPTPFLVMAYIPGEDLESRIRRFGPLSEAEAIHLIGTIARSLHECHKRGVVHRDIKPANILIHEDGAPFLTDFGLTSNSNFDGLTATGEVLGTPRCMAPEQLLAAEVSPATDVWALGVTLYFCLSGEWPFRAESSMELAAQIINGKPQLPLAPAGPFSKRTQALIARALEKEEERRHKSSLDFARACESSSAEQGRGALPLIFIALLLAFALPGAGLWFLQSKAEAMRRISEFEAELAALPLELSEDEVLIRCALRRLGGPTEDIGASLARLGERWQRLEDAGLAKELSASQRARLSQAAVFEAQSREPRRLARFVPAAWRPSAGEDSASRPGQKLRILDDAVGACEKGRFADAQARWREFIVGESERASELQAAWRVFSSRAFVAELCSEDGSLSGLERGLELWFADLPRSLESAAPLNKALRSRLGATELSREAGARCLAGLDELSHRWPILRARAESRYHRARAEDPRIVEPALVLYHKVQAELADRVTILPRELDPYVILSDLSFERSSSRRSELSNGTAFWRMAAELASAGLMLPIESFLYYDLPDGPSPTPSAVYAERPWDHGYRLWAFIQSCRGRLSEADQVARRATLQSLLQSSELNEQQRACARIYFCYALLGSLPTEARAEREWIAAQLYELVDAPLAGPEEVCLAALGLHIDLYIERAEPAMESKFRALHKKLRGFVAERLARSSLAERTQGRPAWAPFSVCDADLTRGRAFEGELMIYGNLARSEAAEVETYEQIIAHACRDPWQAEVSARMLVDRGHLRRAEDLMHSLRASQVESRDPGAWAAALRLLPEELRAKFLR